MLIITRACQVRSYLGSYRFFVIRAHTEATMEYYTQFLFNKQISKES